MNSIKLSKIRKTRIALSLIFGFLLLSAAGINAQSADNRNSVQNSPNSIRLADDGDISRVARVQGYNDGLRRAAKDARKRHKNPQKTAEYKNATNGYELYYSSKKESKRIYGGNKKLYKQAYNGKRKLYQQAYRDGFLEGFSKADNDNSVARQSVAVRRKPGFFHRIRRFIFRR